MTDAPRPLNFTEALNASISKLFYFHGRSRRSEFWWTQLVVYLASITIPFLGFVFHILTIPLTFRRLHDTGRSGWWWGFGALLNFAFWGVIIYEISLTLGTITYYPNYYFDETTSSNYIILYAILGVTMIIYNIVLLIFCCLDSEPYENKYGESPKYGYNEMNNNNYNI